MENANTDPAEQRAMRILIVDDAAMNRKLLARLLMKAGHICEQAADGNEACEIVKGSDYRFDTILMDKEMPECDGPTAVSRLRKSGCDSFIVGLTGSVLPEDIEAFKYSGANQILAKPFKQKELEDLWVEYSVQRSGAGEGVFQGQPGEPNSGQALRVEGA